MKRSKGSWILNDIIESWLPCVDEGHKTREIFKALSTLHQGIQKTESLGQNNINFYRFNIAKTEPGEIKKV